MPNVVALQGRIGSSANSQCWSDTLKREDMGGLIHQSVSALVVERSHTDLRADMCLTSAAWHRTNPFVSDFDCARIPS